MPLSGLIRSTVFAFLNLLILVGLGQNKPSVVEKKYAPAQLKEDATLLKRVTLAMHPAVGIYHPRSYYEQVFDTYIARLTDSLTERDFRLRTKLVMDELHCGHTEVLYSKAYYKVMNKRKLNYSPYIFLPVRDQIFVLTNLNKKADSTLKKGMEVTRINTVPADSLLRYCKRFISADGYNRSSRDHYIQLAFNSYYPALFGRPDTFRVEYREGNTLKTLHYPAFQPKSFPPIPLGPKDDSLFVRYKKARIRYRYLDSSQKTLLVKIEKFSHRKAGKAYRRIFKKIQRQRVQNLVIDLRNNGGGSIGNAYTLLTYLSDTAHTQTLRTSIKHYPYKKYTKGNVMFRFTRFAFLVIGKKRSVHDTDYFVYTIRPRKKRHFNGKVVVLINGGSFSASCLVAAYLRNRPNTVFVGEETGGAQEGCNAGITPYYKLPHTSIRVRMPAFRIVHDVSPAITARGIQPDYPVQYSISDILNKRDLELAKVKELLR